jgi:hypothetical protein
MAQVTWRTDDELLDRVRHAATAAGWSVNESLTRVAGAATDPGLSGDELTQVRERLARAGLLEEPRPVRTTRPDPAAVREAKAAAASGTPLSELVSEGRE